VSRGKRKSIDGTTYLSATRLLASVGINLLALRYRLADIDPNEWYTEWAQVVDELELYSLLLAAFVEGREEALDEISVALPVNVVAVTSPNPFYKAKGKTPTDKREGVDHYDVGDIPF